MHVAAYYGNVSVVVMLLQNGGSPDVTNMVREIILLMEILKACFPLGEFCSREQREKQLDWLATNTDDTITQSHSLFACSRKKNHLVENGL